ncbi:MFS transporter [bacterium]|nr:MAG: MFS transporter [bacterium]
MSSGMFFSSATMMFQFYAQGWFILGMTSSAALLGLLGVSRGTGMLVFSLYGGALADRMDRRTLLIVTQSAAFVIYGVLSVLVITDHVGLWLAFGLIFLSASVESMDAPTRQALVPLLVPREHLPNAVALFIAAQISAYAFLPPMAGLAIETIGTGGAFAISLIGHAVVVGALLTLKVRAMPPASAQSVVRSVGDGIRYAAGRQRVLWVLVFGIFVGVLGFPIISTLAPYWMKNELGLGAGGWTLMGWIWGLGTVVSTVTLSTRNTPRHLGRIIIGATTGFGLTLVVFGLTRSLPLAAAAWCLNGTFFTANMIASTSLLQMIVENQYMGRVMSLRGISSSLNQIAAAPLGAVADWVGMSRMVPAVATLLTMLIITPAAASKTVRTLDAEAQKPLEDAAAT